MIGQDSRYRDNADGTVTDLYTGLMWKKCLLGKSGDDCNIGTIEEFKWAGALDAAEKLQLAGHSDWRMPNMKEMQTLMAYDRSKPAINLSVFPETPPSDIMWTSSFVPNGASNGVLKGIQGFKISSGKSASLERDDKALVRLVRN